MSDDKHEDEPKVYSESEMRQILDYEIRKVAPIYQLIGNNNAYHEVNERMKRQSEDLEYPLNALPDNLRRPIEAIHDVTQAPIALCAQSVLGAVSTAVQGLADVAPPFQGARPVSCFFMTLAESGERKSSVDRLAMMGIHRYHEDLQNQYNDEIGPYTISAEAYKKAKTAATKGLSGVASITAAIEDLGPEPREPLDPTLVISDPTFDGLFRLFQHGQPSIGLLSDEGGKFIGGPGMSGDGAARTAGALSSIWDGQQVDKVRGNQPATIIKGRRMTTHLMVQPYIASSLLHNETMKQQGILARFLLSYPNSRIGYREFKAAPQMALEEINRFADRLYEIFALPKNTHPDRLNELQLEAVTFDRDATGLWMDFGVEVERKQQPDNHYFDVKSFASKAAENAARLAAIMCLFKNPQNRIAEKEDVASAVALMRYHMSEVLNFYTVSAQEANEKMADGLYRWLTTKWACDLVSPVDIGQGATPKKVRPRAVCDKLLAILEERGLVEKLDGSHDVKGNTRQEVWRIL